MNEKLLQRMRSSAFGQKSQVTTALSPRRHGAEAGDSRDSPERPRFQKITLQTEESPVSARQGRPHPQQLLKLKARVETEEGAERSPSPSKIRGLDYIGERYVHQLKSYHLATSTHYGKAPGASGAKARNLDTASIGSFDETESENSLSNEHEVWDNREMANMGFDLLAWRDPKGNPISFLTLYKARSSLFPTKRETLNNYQTVNRAIRLARGNRRSKSAQYWEQEYKFFLTYDDFDYSFRLEEYIPPADPVAGDTPRQKQKRGLFSIQDFKNSDAGTGQSGVHFPHFRSQKIIPS